jgi:hypothetical protein
MLNVFKLSVIMVSVVVPFQVPYGRAIESFITLAPGACTIELFTAVIYGFL